MLNLKIETPVECSYGTGFDNLIDRNEMIKMYHEMIFGNEVCVSSKNETTDMSKFIETLINSDNEFKVVTDNVSFIKNVNKYLRGIQEDKRILVIDNHNFFHRLFHSVPVMTDSKGRDTGVLKALSNLIKWLIAHQKYSHVIFASEGGDLHRKKYFKDYKGTRSETSISLINQIKLCEDFLCDIGFSVIRIPGYEADDILASVVNLASKVNIPVTAFSSDKDIVQLGTYIDFEIIDPKTKEVKLAKDISINKFGVDVSKFLDYQAIVGDTSDNIPGAKGFGPKAAVELLSKYDSINDIYNNIDDLWVEDGQTKAKRESVKRNQEKLLAEHANVFISKNLVKLSQYLDIDIYQPCPYKNMEVIIKDKLLAYDISY